MPRDRALLEDVRAHAARAHNLVEGRSREEFADDDVLVDAVLWNLTIAGEAARQLSDDLRARHPEVEWRDPIDFRNRVTHGYATIDREIVFRTAMVFAPELVERVDAVIAAEFTDEDTP
jgi:uncharacterized protein with HEPN domain